MGFLYRPDPRPPMMTPLKPRSWRRCPGVSIIRLTHMKVETKPGKGTTKAAAQADFGLRVL
jgi:hypothetical protein